MSDNSPGEIRFSGSGIYHIKVLGEVSREIWDYFNGEIDQIKKKNGQVITSLKIHVHDQAELAGIIKMLYDWQRVLLLVKRERQDEQMGIK